MKISLGKKLFLGIGVAVLLVGIISGVGIRNLAVFNRDVTELNEEHSEMAAIHNLVISFQQLHMPAHEYLIHGHKEEREKFANLLSETNRSLAKSKVLFDRKNKKEPLAKFEKRLAKVESLALKILVLEDPVKNSEGQRMMEEMDTIADKAVLDINRTVKETGQEMAEQRAGKKKARDLATQFTILLSLIMIFGSAVGGFLFVTGITRPARELLQLTKKVSRGDLSAKIEVASTDEIGDLAQSFNVMTENLKKSTTSIDKLHKEIAARKKAEEESLREKNKLSALIDSIGDYGLSIQNTDYDIIFQNKLVQELVGGLGQKCYKVYEDRDKVCPGCPAKMAFEDGLSHTSVRKVNGPDGEINYWENTATVIRDEHGKVVSCVEIAKNITDHKKREEERELLNKELRLANEKLKQLVFKDPHTALYNYRYLEQAMKKEFELAKRHGHPFSILMFDIDYFKSINDVYGHQFGDLVLQQFAKFLMARVRKSDTVVRFGGEEFIILSPNTARTEALIAAQRHLESINSRSFGDKKRCLKLKVSGAVASYPEDKVVEPADLLKIADHVLRKIKEDGGNRVYNSVCLRTERPGLTSVISTEESAGHADVTFLKEKLEKLKKRANQSLAEAIFAFAKTLEVKDHYTGEHVEKTVYYATETARALGLDAGQVEIIRQAAMLHDLGKIGISDKILLKRGKLTNKELDHIKKHPQIGVDIIRPIQFLRELIPLMLYHHERWDGKGYPKGLKGEQIPLEARIIAIADVFQALTSKRPYRKAYSRDEAVNIIKEASGNQFDPRIVEAFLHILERSKEGRFARTPT